MRLNWRDDYIFDGDKYRKGYIFQDNQKKNICKFTLFGFDESNDVETTDSWVVCGKERYAKFWRLLLRESIRQGGKSKVV